MSMRMAASACQVLHERVLPRGAVMGWGGGVPMSEAEVWAGRCWVIRVRGDLPLGRLRRAPMVAVVVMSVTFRERLVLRPGRPGEGCAMRTT